MKIIINSDKKYKFSFIKKLTVIHLGKNPKKGGNPPKDKKFIIKNNFIILFEFKFE